MKLILETDRLWLREFSLDDATALFELDGDLEVVRYTGKAPLSSVEEARQRIAERMLADYVRHGFGRWAMVLKGDPASDPAGKEPGGAPIGVAGLKWLPELEEVDIGYGLLPRYWGRGLATEAARAAIGYGFRTLGLSRIIGLVDPPHRKMRPRLRTGRRVPRARSPAIRARRTACGSAPSRNIIKAARATWIARNRPPDSKNSLHPLETL